MRGKSGKRRRYRADPDAAAVTAVAAAVVTAAAAVDVFVDEGQLRVATKVFHRSIRPWKRRRKRPCRWPASPLQ